MHSLIVRLLLSVIFVSPAAHLASSFTVNWGGGGILTP